MITVARDVSHHRWRDDAGVYARQEVQITQAENSATVAGLSGSRREMGPHLVRVFHPKVFSEVEFAWQLAAANHCVTKDEFLSAMVVTDYDWGKLLEINWTALDYCPGGLHYYLLPSDHPVIDLAGLTLDWPSVDIIPI